MSSRRLTFVVGTGRCGSTALSGVLRLHPQVLGLSELFTAMAPHAFPSGPIGGAEFWRLLSTPRPFADRMTGNGITVPEYVYPRIPGGRYSAATGGVPTISMMTLAHLTDEPDALFDALAPRVTALPPAPVADQYRALFAALCDLRGGGQRAVVERSGYSLRWVPRLRELFPEASFVHLYRDGADCALSMSRHPAFRVFRLRDAALPEHERPPRDMAELLADESFDLRPLLQGPISPAGFGRFWSEMIVEGLGHLDRLPDRRRVELSYERLLDEPDGELLRLAGHLGVDPLPEWLAAARQLLDGGRRGAANRLAPDELAALRESCEPGTRALERRGALSSR